MEPQESPASEIRSPATREVILHAAVKVLAREGVLGARVEEIAAGAGVSPGLLNYHFGNRQALLRAGLIAALRMRADPEIVRRASVLHILSGGMVRDRATDGELTAGSSTVSGAWWRIRSDALREAVFDAEVRAAIGEATATWVGYVAERLPGSDPVSVKRERATMLVALVDGLRQRVASDVLSREVAAARLADAVERDAVRAERRA